MNAHYHGWMRRTALAGAGAVFGILLDTGGGIGMVPGKGEGPRMIAVPAGRFTMGSNAGHWDQGPAHPVRLSSAFRISADRVTAEQYRRFRPGADLREEDGAACGVSWHDAQAYCRWLSRREGVPYRLPTEAEWEYVRRSAERLGARGMGGGALEWCADWYGDYPAQGQVDPIGPAQGVARVVRGGPLDQLDPAFRFLPAEEYMQPWYRAGMPPSFGIHLGGGPVSPGAAESPGLVGVWYGSSDFTRPQALDPLLSLQAEWAGDGMRGSDWSAEWHGLLEPPVTGEALLEAEADGMVELRIDGRTVLAGSAAGGTRGTVSMVIGRTQRVRLRYAHRGGACRLRILWTLPGRMREEVPVAAIRHDPEAARAAAALLPGGAGDGPGRHRIGFRVVQAEAPRSATVAVAVPFAQRGVRKPGPWSLQGPDPAKPYFRRRPALPIPPETDGRPEYRSAIDAAGFHPSFRGHNHSPGLAVCDNGDILAVYYTSYREYEPEVSLIMARLRHGSDEWDMPSRFIDLPGANDHAPLLWADGGAIHLFWGSPKLEAGAFPFQWVTSRDNGATWGEVRFPELRGPVGPHSRQPINSAFRGPDGAMYLASDAAGSTSLLWTSRDGGKVWRDTGGRTAGRHTAFCPLGDGRILALGGKNTDIDGAMPRAISDDGGRTWKVDRSPFCAQGGNQRPSLLRLANGSLVFAADFQRTGGARPAGATETGSYVALSRDEGRTWRFRRIPGAMEHESGPGFFGGLPGATTLGYSALRQAPNGVIHLLTTMNRPCLHFEFNEAWILADDAAPGHADLRAAPEGIHGVREHTERYPDGRLRLRWHAGIAPDGRVLMHGPEAWYYPDGSKQYEATWRMGRRAGTETAWNPGGRREWQWNRSDGGASVWTQWWNNGRRRAVSTWREFEAHGPARLYDRAGRLFVERTFP